MDNEAIIGTVIMLLCCWGCAGIFLGIGLCGEKRRTPMHFWAGSKIDPHSVSNISAYNRENALMWKWYSIPYWIAGICPLLGRGEDWAYMVSVGALFLATVPGLPILIKNYNRIARKYIQTGEK